MGCSIFYLGLRIADRERQILDHGRAHRLTAPLKSSDSPAPKSESARAVGPPIALLFILIALAHVSSLLADLLTDDYFNVRNALTAGWSWPHLMQGFAIDVSRLHDGWQFPSFAGVTVRYFRPLFLASLLVDHAIWGLQPWGYHLTNILLHLAVVALFYGLLCELLGGRKRIVWFGAFLYGILPCHVAAVGWLSGRTELLPALAMMASLWACLRFARTGRLSLYVLSVATAAVGLLAKENAVILPLIALAAWLWLVPRPRPSAWSLVPYAALVIVYLPLRYWILGGFPLPPPSFYYHSPSEPGFVWWALGKAVCLFYDMVFQLPLAFPFDLVLARHPGVIIALLIPAVGIAEWLLHLIRTDPDISRRRLACFAVAWIVLGLLPTAPLMLFGLYFYFPIGGIILLYLTIWMRLAEGGRPRWLNRKRPRRVLLISVAMLLTFWLEMGNAALIVMGQSARWFVDQIVAEVGKPKQGLRIHIVDLPLLAGPIKDALQLHWPGREFEIHALSITPYLAPVGRPISQLDQLDSQTLRLTALGRPYLSGIIGLIAIGAQHRETIKAGQIWPVRGYRIEITQEGRGDPWHMNGFRQFVFHFDEAMASPRNVFLRFVDGKVERIPIR